MSQILFTVMVSTFLCLTGLHAQVAKLGNASSTVQQTQAPKPSAPNVTSPLSFPVDKKTTEIPLEAPASTKVPAPTGKGGKGESTLPAQVTTTVVLTGTNGFDGASFFGGFVLAIGLAVIGLVVFKVCFNRSGPNYSHF